jgi:hypothetical protein
MQANGSYDERPASSTSEPCGELERPLQGRADAAGTGSVLIAGGDSAERAAVLYQLASSFPETMAFEEASACWEVLARAPHSRIVILSGDLDDGPASSFMRTLGDRHPDLPVVSLRASALAPAR